MNFKEYLDEDNREFKRQELKHELGHEINNIQIVINGKNWKVIAGGKDNSSQMQRAQQIAEKIVATLKTKGKTASWHITGASIT